METNRQQPEPATETAPQRLPPGHRRTGSQPNPPRGSISIQQLSQLERQWSTGDGLSIYGSFGMSSTAPDDFHATWAGTASGAPMMSSSMAPPPPPSAAVVHPLAQPPPRRAPPAAYHESFGPSANGMFNGIDHDAPGIISSIIHDEARVMGWDKVMELSNSQPQHAQYAGPDGWTALHHVFNRRCARDDVVKALITAYPEALMALEEKDMTPLHYACRFKAPRETVRLLLQLFPDIGKQAVGLRDVKGRTPLWYAVRYDAPKGVVEMLLEIDPKTILERDRTGESPLSLVWDTWAEKFEGKKALAPFVAPPAGEKKSAEQARGDFAKLLERNSKLKGIWQTTNLLLKYHFGLQQQQQSSNSNNNGSSSSSAERKFRMLHATAAIACHPTLFLIAKALYPEQATELDESDLTEGTKTALHLAASCSAAADSAKTVVLSLLELNPQAVETKDSPSQSLPLHRMVESKKHWVHDGIRDVQRAYPTALREPDSEGRLPLHRAAAASAHGGGQGGSIILQLLEEYPEAASHTDTGGKLPLHHIAQHYGGEWGDEVEAIFRAHEAAVRTRAGDKMPLHLAASSRCATQSLLEGLVEHHARGARQTDRSGKLPLHLACESGKTWDKICAICESYPDAVREPANGLVALQMVAALEKSPKCVIEELVTRYPQGAHRKDDSGRYALHLACASGKLWQTGLKEILQANPSANISEDNEGLLPLHIAARLYCCKEKDSDNDKDKKPAARQVLRGSRATSMGVRQAVVRSNSFAGEAAPPQSLRRSGRAASSAGRTRGNSVSEPDMEAPKLEVLYQLLMADPNILPKY